MGPTIVLIINILITTVIIVIIAILVVGVLLRVIFVITAEGVGPTEAMSPVTHHHPVFIAVVIVFIVAVAVLQRQELMGGVPREVHI